MDIYGAHDDQVALHYVVGNMTPRGAVSRERRPAPRCVVHDVFGQGRLDMLVDGIWPLWQLDSLTPLEDEEKTEKYPRGYLLV